jgi:hypothetical protein
VAVPLAPRLERHLAMVRRRDKPLGPALAALVAALEGSRAKAALALAQRVGRD